MDTLICSGDHKTDGRGIPIKVSGDEEIAQQIIIRLTVPLGRFSLDKSLGSLLYSLPKSDSETNRQRAIQYIKSALVDIDGAIVRDVSLNYLPLYDRLEIKIKIEIDNKSINLEVNV